MCPTDEILRAKIDGELSRTETIDVEIHLTACAGCRERAEVLARQARRLATSSRRSRFHPARL